MEQSAPPPFTICPNACFTHSSTCLDFLSVGASGVMYTGGEGGGEGEESSIEDLTGFMGSSELLALWNSIQYQITENKLLANFSGEYNMLSQLHKHSPVVAENGKTARSDHTHSEYWQDIHRSALTSIHTLSNACAGDYLIIVTHTKHASTSSTKYSCFNTRVPIGGTVPSLEYNIWGIFKGWSLPYVPY